MLLIGVSHQWSSRVLVPVVVAIWEREVRRVILPSGSPGKGAEVGERASLSLPSLRPQHAPLKSGK